MKFRSKLLLTIVSLIGFAVIGLGAIFMHLIEKNSFGHFEGYMQSQAEAVSDFIEGHGGTGAVDEGMKDSLNLLQNNLAIVSQKAEVIYSKPWMETCIISGSQSRTRKERLQAMWSCPIRSMIKAFSKEVRC